MKTILKTRFGRYETGSELVSCSASTTNEFTSGNGSSKNFNKSLKKTWSKMEKTPVKTHGS